MESFQTRFCVVDKHSWAVPFKSACMHRNEKFTQKGLFTHVVMPARNESSNVMLNKSLGYTLPQILFDIITQAKVHWTLQ